MGVTIEDLSDLSPNMRKVLSENSDGVHSKDTYWITLQGMIARGLLTRPTERRGFHTFTARGLLFREALAKVVVAGG